MGQADCAVLSRCFFASRVCVSWAPWWVGGLVAGKLRRRLGWVGLGLGGGLDVDSDSMSAVDGLVRYAL